MAWHADGEEATGAGRGGWESGGEAGGQVEREAGRRGARKGAGRARACSVHLRPRGAEEAPGCRPPASGHDAQGGAEPGARTARAGAARTAILRPRSPGRGPGPLPGRLGGGEGARDPARPAPAAARREGAPRPPPAQPGAEAGAERGAEVRAADDVPGSPDGARG